MNFKDHNNSFHTKKWMKFYWKFGVTIAEISNWLDCVPVDDSDPFSCCLNPKCKFIVTSNDSKCFYRRLIEAFHSTFPPFHFIPRQTLQWITVWTMFHPSILMIITFRNFFENIWLTLNLKRDFVADIWNTRLRLAIAVRLETVSSLVRTPR